MLKTSLCSKNVCFRAPRFAQFRYKMKNRDSYYNFVVYEVYSCFKTCRVIKVSIIRCFFFTSFIFRPSIQSSIPAKQKTKLSDKKAMFVILLNEIFDPTEFCNFGREKYSYTHIFENFKNLLNVSVFRYISHFGVSQ